MNILASMKYQFANQRNSVLTYYLCLIGFIVIGFVSAYRQPVDESFCYVTYSGANCITAFLAFVLGCCSFKTNFQMAVQNGVSRRSLFLGRLLTTAALCLITAVCDELMTLLINGAGRVLSIATNSISLLELMFEPQGQPWLVALEAVPFGFFFLMAASAAGYFCTVVLYRLSTRGKVWLLVGLCILLPNCLMLVGNLVYRFGLFPLFQSALDKLGSLVAWSFDGVGNWMIAWFVVFLVFSGLTWLVMRKIPLKK